MPPNRLPPDHFARVSERRALIVPPPESPVRTAKRMPVTQAGPPRRIPRTVQHFRPQSLSLPLRRSVTLPPDAHATLAKAAEPFAVRPFCPHFGKKSVLRTSRPNHRHARSQADARNASGPAVPYSAHRSAFPSAVAFPAASPGALPFRRTCPPFRRLLTLRMLFLCGVYVH